jgi:CheY-specific phosphatase CheX
MSVTEDAFCGIAQDTWTSTLGFAIEGATVDDLPSDGTLTACVRISGAWEGEVQLHCPVPLARSIAAAIFQVNEEAASEEEMLDALSELVHIVGGNLKPLLPSPVNVSLPCLPDSPCEQDTASRSQMIHCLTLASEGHAFTVSLLEHVSPATTAVG